MTDAAGGKIKVGDIVIWIDSEDEEKLGLRMIVRDIRRPWRRVSGPFRNVFLRGPRKGQFIPGSMDSEWRFRIDDAVDVPGFRPCKFSSAVWAAPEQVVKVIEAKE